MNIPEIIASVEERYKKILEDYFRSVFPGDSLSSHGIDHHKRVWIYGKDLFSRVILPGDKEAYRCASSLIMACYLHDAGMAIDQGEKHGKLGRELSSEFLRKNGLLAEDFREALEAIEFHDDKFYKNHHENDILRILSVADDLDAFGITGIYRYIEIYLARGIDPALIGSMIRQNAGRRFENFISQFGYLEDFAAVHKERYLTLDSFFKKYDEELSSYKFGISSYKGHCGVVDILADLAINKRSIEKYLDKNNFTDDQVISKYFMELKTELYPCDSSG